MLDARNTKNPISRRLGHIGKIPVRIEKIASADEEGGVEVFIDLDDFEVTGASVRIDIREFKVAYLRAVEAAGGPTHRRERGGGEGG